MKKGGHYISDERLAEIVRVHQESGSLEECEKKLGISRSTIGFHIRTAGRLGLLGTKPVIKGFEITQVTNTPRGDYVQQRQERGPRYKPTSGHQVRGVSSLVGGDGRVIQEWIKTATGVDPERAAQALREAFENFEPSAARTTLSELDYSNYLTLYPISDMHIGMFAWKAEAGSNWDLKIAEREISAAYEKVVRRTEPSKVAVVLGGGDAIHVDSNAGATMKGTHLDVDGRYDKVIDVTAHLFVKIIDMALENHEKVIVRVLKGNHDGNASVAVACFLFAWYRNEPRVEVDKGPSLFWNYRFGLVMLAATHGHEAKPADMPGIMAGRWGEDWGRTKYRYAHTFHEHHLTKRTSESSGAITETHQAPCAQDAWGFGRGFVSGRSMCSIAYDPDFGEVARITVPL